MSLYSGFRVAHGLFKGPCVRSLCRSTRRTAYHPIRHPPDIEPDWVGAEPLRNLTVAVVSQRPLKHNERPGFCIVKSLVDWVKPIKLMVVGSLGL